jgi:hypothetical protein
LRYSFSAKGVALINKEKSPSVFLMMLALVGVIAVFSIGCGGGDSDASGAGADSGAPDGQIATSSLGKAQFVAKINAFCKARHQQVVREVTDFSLSYAQRNPDADVGDAYPGGIRLLLAQIQDQVDAVRDLGAPAGDESKVEAILVAMEDGIEATEKKQPIENATQVFLAFKPSTDLLNAYGLDACGY